MTARFLLPFLLISVPAQAAAPADCAGLMLAGMQRASYRTQAAFPAEPETVNVEFFSGGPARLTAFCGFVFKPDPKARTLTVTARQFSAFANVFRDGYRNTGRIVLENRSYGAVPHASNVVFDLAERQLTFDAAGLPVMPLTVGVSVDGGPLKALFYRNTATPQRVPKTARSVDIYVKAPGGTTLDWQRVRFDIQKSTVTFYRSAAFPRR
ncbi:hypothetical protein [Deinococcus sedimenti]|uniref:Outer membrane lipoprotein carrier protein LolA n=1 Tax=Deinococcus sedimenti TaxID=1867090 RepID=A0ABQ2SAI1_9DEIO|nr:hypothetical protein [Deinococcus sedimenti]GGS05540.1 hypothetical protein GCM10008960_35040 [Deinococcus sedimenti]